MKQPNMSCTKENIFGAIRRFELLTAAARDPSVAPKAVLQACSRQGLLAALKIGKENIAPMSLNTLKKASDLAVEGGWSALNKLRREVARSGKQAKGVSPKAGRNEIRVRLKELEHRLDQERRARTVLNRAYSDVVNKLRKVAEIDDRLKVELARHTVTFNIPTNLEIVGRES